MSYDIVWDHLIRCNFTRPQLREISQSVYAPSVYKEVAKEILRILETSI